VESGADIPESLSNLHQIEAEYYAVSISEQILFSDWWAHYKFFAQQQIDWIERHKRFTLKDKIPLSARLMLLTLLLVFLAGLAYAGLSMLPCIV
jgi:hypothetical protein